MKTIEERKQELEKENQALQTRKDNNNIELATLEAEANRLQNLANIEIEKISRKKNENQEIDKKIEKKQNRFRKYLK